jgi:hypothetical protein
MIVKICKDVEKNAPNLRLSSRIATPRTIKVELREIVKFFPLLFISGIFTGIAIMLALNG